MKSERISAESVARVRVIPLRRAAEAAGCLVALDPSYVPRGDVRSERWSVSVDGGNVELVVTDSVWFDTRAGKGGRGPVDLVMHLRRLTFLRAVRLLLKG